MKVGSKPWRQMIVDGGRELGVTVDAAQVDLFAVHAEELLFWNRKTNLTAITDPVEIAVKHFLDSIAALPMIPEQGRLLDLGSGGGFPGIPIKIMRPKLQVTLVDASRKKCSFLRHLIRSLQMDGVESVHARSGDLATDAAYAGACGVVTSRAYSDFKRFCADALPLLATGGKILAYLGSREPAAETSEKIVRGLIFHENKSGPDPVFDIRLEIKRFRLPFIEHPRAVLVLHIDPENR
jgi:16S rRNA (guanine527-N7)-methyltransferase